MADGAAPGIGVMLGATGPCPEFPCNGKTWRVGYPTQKAKKRLELLVKKAVLDEARELKSILDTASYQELYESKSKNLANYETWRPGWQDVVQDPANAHLFFWSLLQEHHPDVTGEEVMDLCLEAPEEVQAALAQVLPPFFRMLVEAALAKVPKNRPDLKQQVEAAVAPALEELQARLMRTPAKSST